MARVLGSEASPSAMIKQRIRSHYPESGKAPQSIILNNILTSITFNRVTAVGRTRETTATITAVLALTTTMQRPFHRATARKINRANTKKMNRTRTRHRLAFLGSVKHRPPIMID